MKKLYIVGCGGFGREVLWLARRINEVKSEWNIMGFIDDNEELHGTYQDELKVVGGCDYLTNLDTECWVVCAVGSAVIKEQIVQKLQCEHIHFATLIDPSVLISDRVLVGQGTIICAGTILTVDISIGNHVIINLDCTLGHDVDIQDYVTIYPSVNVSGNVSVGKKAELGTGAAIIQGKCIGEEAIIGAGSVVVKDIPVKCTAVGSPCKPIKFHGDVS
ncbi:MAG: acetyltransferase [Lachnospiraceae bacterium]|nr:acetyltransferase [Lachnospiraceae bacterium]